MSGEATTAEAMTYFSLLNKHKALKAEIGQLMKLLAPMKVCGHCGGNGWQPIDSTCGPAIHSRMVCIWCKGSGKAEETVLTREIERIEQLMK